MKATKADIALIFILNAVFWGVIAFTEYGVI